MIRFQGLCRNSPRAHATRRIIRFATAFSSIVSFFLFLSTNRIANQRENFEISSDLSWSSNELTPFHGPHCLGKLEVIRILLVLRVHAPYSDTRNYVRTKISNTSQCGVKAVFLYGKFVGDKARAFQSLINDEQRHFGDVVQFGAVLDYHLRGQRAVNMIRSWIVLDPCTVYHQVAFGTFQLAAEKLYHSKTYGKEEANWALDDCLKFTVFKRTNVQFFAHYFPPHPSSQTAAQVSRTLQQSGHFEYQDSVVSPHDFEYLVEPPETTGICRGNQSYFAVIAVHSGANSSSNRNMIRQTWANSQILTKYNMALVFFLGRRARQSRTDTAKLRNEADSFGDIIQEDFVDSYKNMTLKQVSVLKYFAKNCRHIKYDYLFKADDDIVLDLRSIRRYMDTIPKSGLSPARSIYCFHMNELAYVPRYMGTKWLVSQVEYPNNLYPAYCSGAGYLITKDLVSVLYDAALHVRTFWVDDTLISGVLPQAVGNVSLIQIPKQSLESINFLRKYGDLGQLMLVHVSQDMELFQIYWDKFKSAN